jgi:hypothetical protein
MNFAAIVYGIAPTWIMGILVWLVALENWQLSRLVKSNRWQKRIKAITWFVFGAVYIADHILNPLPDDVRIYYRVTLFFLVLGEVGYHARVLMDIARATKKKVKQREYGQ